MTDTHGRACEEHTEQPVCITRLRCWFVYFLGVKKCIKHMPACARWYRPSVDVVGMVSGHTGEGIKTILPSKASAKLSSRIVPNMDPAATLRALRAHLQRHAPPTANLSFVEVDFSAAAYDCPRESVGNRVAARVLQGIMGGAPRYERSGGTIPALALFKKHLGIDTTVFGFGLPDDAIHAPDERYSLEFFKTGRDAVIGFLFELGGASQNGGTGCAAQ